MLSFRTCLLLCLAVACGPKAPMTTDGDESATGDTVATTGATTDAPTTSTGGPDDVPTCPGGQEPFTSVWVTTSSGPGGVVPWDLATDAQGRSVITGQVSLGAVDFGGGPLPGDHLNGFIAAYDAGGAHLWSKRFGSDFTAGWGIAVDDDDGAVVLVGHYGGPLDLGDGPQPDKLGGAFVARFSAAGDHLWTRQFEGHDAIPYDVGLASTGEISVAGRYTDDTLDFGGGPLPAASSPSAFVVRLDAAGEHLWSRGFPGPQSSESESHWLAVNAAGQTAVEFTYSGSIDFGGGPLVPHGGSDIAVAVFEPDGAHRWSGSWGSAEDSDLREFIDGLVLDDAGQVFLSATIADAIDFGGGPLVSAGEGDLVVAAFDPDGAYRWSRRFGDAANQYSGKLALGDDGVLRLTGGVTGVLALDDVVLQSADSAVFLARFTQDGTFTAAQTITTGSALGRALAVDRCGDILLAGEFWRDVTIGGSALFNPDAVADSFVAKFR